MDGDQVAAFRLLEAELRLFKNAISFFRRVIFVTASTRSIDWRCRFGRIRTRPSNISYAQPRPPTNPAGTNTHTDRHTNRRGAREQPLSGHVAAHPAPTSTQDKEIDIPFKGKPLPPSLGPQAYRLVVGSWSSSGAVRMCFRRTRLSLVFNL